MFCQAKRVPLVEVFSRRKTVSIESLKITFIEYNHNSDLITLFERGFVLQTQQTHKPYKNMHCHSKFTNTEHNLPIS